MFYIPKSAIVNEENKDEIMKIVEGIDDTNLHINGEDNETEKAIQQLKDIGEIEIANLISNR